MKKMNLIRFGAVAAMAAGMVFAQAPARNNMQATAGQQHTMTWQQRRERLQQRMTRELNLTPAQQQLQKAIFARMREKATPIRQELRENREALSAAIKSDNTREIHVLTAQAGTLHSQLMELRADAMANFYKTLTPVQRAKADQIHKEMRQRREQRQGEQHPPTT